MRLMSAYIFWFTCFPSPSNPNITLSKMLPSDNKSKAWVYDCEERSLTIRDRKELEKSKLEHEHDDQYLNSNSSRADTNRPYKIKKRQTQIALFFNPVSETVSTSRKSEEGHNEPLAVLMLDRAGIWNNILRVSGRIPVLYVQNLATGSGYNR